MKTAYRSVLWAIARWRRLPASERNALLGMAVVIPVAAVSVRWAGLRRTLVLLQSDHARPADAPRSIALGRLTLARARRYAPYKGNCLSQSLSLWRLLRRDGLDVQLRIGARVVNQRLEAHAWVEYEGAPINDVTNVATEYEAKFDLTTDFRSTTRWS